MNYDRLIKKFLKYAEHHYYDRHDGDAASKKESAEWALSTINHRMSLLNHYIHNFDEEITSKIINLDKYNVGSLYPYDVDPHILSIFFKHKNFDHYNVLLFKKFTSENLNSKYFKKNIINFIKNKIKNLYLELNSYKKDYELIAPPEKSVKENLSDNIIQILQKCNFEDSNLDGFFDMCKYNSIIIYQGSMNYTILSNDDKFTINNILEYNTNEDLEHFYNLLISS